MISNITLLEEGTQAFTFLINEYGGLFWMKPVKLSLSLQTPDPWFSMSRTLVFPGTFQVGPRFCWMCNIYSASAENAQYLRHAGLRTGWRWCMRSTTWSFWMMGSTPWCQHSAEGCLLGCMEKVGFWEHEGKRWNWGQENRGSLGNPLIDTTRYC